MDGTIKLETNSYTAQVVAYSILFILNSKFIKKFMK